MMENRLKHYSSEADFRVSAEPNFLETSKERKIIIITFNQYDLSDNKKETDLSWSNDIFNYITESLLEIQAIKKIIIDISLPDIVRIWSVVEKESKDISKQIYSKEKEILEYLVNFDYDIDFHIITDDMVADIVNKDSKIVLNTKK
jgi:hypothetical protein